MTLQTPMFVSGATHPSNAVRMMIRDLARANEGVIGGTDLKVRQIATPTGQVRVVDGSAFVKGKTSLTSQGTYHVTNIGDTTVDIAPTGASGRSDLVVLRVEDPEYEGNINPATTIPAYIQVVPGVAGTQTTVPNTSWSAVALARIDIPANTAAITDAMITSVRVVANPRRERTLYTVNQSATQDLTVTTYPTFPSQASWTVPVPSWATQVKLIGQANGVRLATGDYAGGFRAVLGTSITTQSTGLSFDAPTGTYRTTLGMADTRTLPLAYQGTNQTLALQAAKTSGTGVLRADTGTSAIVDVEFYETPI